MNISSKNATDLKIYKMILSGLSSAYGTWAKFPDGEISKSTVLRTFKVFEQIGAIKIYEEGKLNGREKKNYGPMPNGIFHYVNAVNLKKPQIEKIYQKWIKHEGFHKEIISLFGEDFGNLDSVEAAETFAVFCNFYAKTIQTFNDFEYQYEIPIEWKVELGERLLEEDHPDEVRRFGQKMWDNSEAFREMLRQKVKEAQERLDSFEKKKKD